MSSQCYTLGIRHHGPGSARAVVRALDAWRPTCVLIEGPSDVQEAIHWAAHEEMRPPVALLVYRVDDPKQATFFPLAEFSPEWCALRWAYSHDVPVRFMDLPQTHALALDAERDASLDRVREETSAEGGVARSDVRRDPLNALARIAGFDDGERWWEHTIEHRDHREGDVFAAIAEAMSALRDVGDLAHDPDGERNALREAWMRNSLRSALKQYDRVVAICGAWHVPALHTEVLTGLRKEDLAQTKDLPKVKTAATWVRWTYDRLTVTSGYGAGVQSPGWYEHLWRCQGHVLEQWMTRVARLLRDEDIDCSSAHVIEAVRLATTLATLRGRPLADLSDIADASRAVFAVDSDLAMRLIGQRLLVGERLGEVPEDMPATPLQRDLEREQKRLRLKPESLEKRIDLDLRKETDLGRSQLLHRLRLLRIDWGTPETMHRGQGTFHELWTLRWDPSNGVRLVELGRWGNTVASAATAWICDLVEKSESLGELTAFLEDVLLADLREGIEVLFARILATASVAADALKLMQAFVPLTGVLRYGNVRQTDRALVRRAVDGMLPRLCVGLAGAVGSLNDEAAAEIAPLMNRVHEGVHLLEAASHTASWCEALAQVADHATAHGLIRGRATRLLFDDQFWTGDEVAERLSRTLSPGTPAMTAAAWIEGLLSGSGTLLLHHHALLELIDRWLVQQTTSAFVEHLPLLRRTFATFTSAERRQIAETLQSGAGTLPAMEGDAFRTCDHARAARVVPALRALLGSGTHV